MSKSNIRLCLYLFNVTSSFILLYGVVDDSGDVTDAAMIYHCPIKKENQIQLLETYNVRKTILTRTMQSRYKVHSVNK